jgi:hypothetical protein
MNADGIRNRRVSRDEGAAAVEFALIAAVLSILIFGMTEFGLFFVQDQSLKAAAREGARVAAAGRPRHEIQAAVISGRGGSLCNGDASCGGTAYDCVWVWVEPYGPSSSTDTCGDVQPDLQSCGPYLANPTLSHEVVVKIPTGVVGTSAYGSGSRDLGKNVTDSFRINIPFLPPLYLHPTITASFRCEQ